jgi:hypothetical protein
MSPKEARELDKLKNIRRINPEPLSTFMPSLQDNSPIGRNSDYSVVGGAAPQGPQDGRAAGRSETKTVNIFVQEGRSADTFIRSRAEIQRAMR